MTVQEAYRERRERVLKPIAAALAAHVIELFNLRKNRELTGYRLAQSRSIAL
jgi:hypothetical protein